MKTVKQINIERLTRDDRTALRAVLCNCVAQARIIGDRALNYEGRIATKLDLIELQLADACEGLRLFLGEPAELDRLSGSDNLNPIVKSSV
jgi:hypothetical protein